MKRAPRELIDGQGRPDQSRPCRRLAAAANGPMTKLTSDSAHRIENGAPNDNPGDRGLRGGDAEDQHRDRQRQHQHRQQQSAAMQRHRQRRADHAGKGQRRRARQQRQRDRRGRERVEIEQQPQHRGGDDQRQSGGQPVRQRLGGAGQFQRRPAHHDQIERAVVMVGHEQPVEREQACQQRAEPEDRRSEPRQQRQIGSDRERHQHHHGEKEQHADQRAAADPQRDPDVPANQGGERGHDAPPIRNSRAAIPSGAWVAATIRPPRAR